MTGRGSGPGDSDGDDGGQYASAPCLAHELSPADLGLATGDEAERRARVLRWRKGERRRLIEMRLALDPAERTRRTRAIEAVLDAAVGGVDGVTIALYWPLRGEPDLRAWIRRALARGARCALPVVVERARPLVFRAWSPGERLERGVWNIPVPAEGETVMPDVVIAPVVGFDHQCFRLGHGGGYYDRTLAAMAVRPRVFGIGYACARIASIHPLSHDVAMDAVVTEEGFFERETHGPDVRGRR